MAKLVYIEPSTDTMYDYTSTTATSTFLTDSNYIKVTKGDNYIVDPELLYETEKKIEEDNKTLVLIELLIAKSVLKPAINTSIFADRRSDMYINKKVMSKLTNDLGVNIYLNDPIKEGYDIETPLGEFDQALIIDALEYLETDSARANLIKEASATIRVERLHKNRLIIIAKSKRMVKELAEKNKYVKKGDKFIIPDDEIFAGNTIQGIDPEELAELVALAGLENIVGYSIKGIDETIIRAGTNRWRF